MYTILTMNMFRKLEIVKFIPAVTKGADTQLTDILKPFYRNKAAYYILFSMCN